MEQKLKYNYYREKEQVVNFKSFFRYIMIHEGNYWLFPLTAFFILIVLANNLAYYRLLAGYNDIYNGQSTLFGQNFTLFWAILIGIVLFLLLMMVLEYYTFMHFELQLDSSRSND